MKKLINVAILFLFVFLILAKTSSADIGPSQPNCPAEWNDNPYQRDLCKVIGKNVSVAVTPKFSANYYFIEKNTFSRFCNSETYALVPDVQGYLALSGTRLYAVKREYFDKAGGFNALFNTTIKKHAPADECPEDVIMKPKNESEFKKNFYDVIVDDNNVEDLAWWEPRSMNPRIIIEKNDNYAMLFPVTAGYSEYPYLVVPVNSPVSEKEFIFSPEMLNCNGFAEYCSLVLYKSKEIWTLDDGNKKEYLFSASTSNIGDKSELLIDDSFQNKAIAQENAGENLINSSVVLNDSEKLKQECATIEKPVEKGFWGKVGCFFKGLVGNKC